MAPVSINKISENQGERLELLTLASNFRGFRVPIGDASAKAIAELLLLNRPRVDCPSTRKLTEDQSVETLVALYHRFAQGWIDLNTDLMARSAAHGIPQTGVIGLTADLQDVSMMRVYKSYIQARFDQLDTATIDDVVLDLYTPAVDW